MHVELSKKEYLYKEFLTGTYDICLKKLTWLAGHTCTQLFYDNLCTYIYKFNNNNRCSNKSYWTSALKCVRALNLRPQRYTTLVNIALARYYYPDWNPMSNHDTKPTVIS